MVPGRFRSTILGAVLGVITTITWVATLELHTGVEHSAYLALLWRLACMGLFAGRNVPVVVWFVGLLLHWPLLGALVDLVRWRRRLRP